VTQRRGAHGALRVGCAVLLIVAPGAARPKGPDVASPETRAPPRVSLQPPPDGAIQRRIEGILAALEGGEDLRVDVRSGVVRLGGRTDSLAVREQAADLAERVEGVVLVQSGIRVDPDVRTRLAPTLAKVRGHLVALVGFLPTLAVALLAFAAFAAMASALGRWEEPFRRLNLSRLGAHVLRDVLRLALVVTGLVVALDIVDVIAIVGAVLGAIGLLGVIAGIAFKDVVSNYLPGLILGLNPPFGPGDRVRIGEHEGKVVRVTSRETVLVTTDGEHLRLPNVRLLQEPILNLERHRERRLRFTLDLALSVDLRRVRDVGRDALLGLTGVLGEPRPFMRVREIEADRVRVQFFAWADQEAANFRNLESRSRRAVVEALLAASVPFPVDEVRVLGEPPAAAAAVPTEGEDLEGHDEALLDAQVEAEQAAPERDLLREGRAPPP
jgi:small-conductance mechanosensitive channel